MNADNKIIAKSLDEIAGLLEMQQADAHRIEAYRKAANSVRETEQPLARIYDEKGRAGFRELRGVGETLSTALESFVRTGSYPMLDRLRGDSAPEAVLRSIPTIGKKTEGELKAHLGIHTLRELEEALYAGELAKVPGMGPKRLRTIQKALEGRDFDDRVHVRDPLVDPNLPSVEELLTLDRQFRELAATGKLAVLPPDDCDVTHGPRPIWHTMRSDRDYTIVYSSSRRLAHHHILPSATDAVTICMDCHDHAEKWTVFTSRFGEFAGKRVVRGREEDCRRFHANEAKAADARRQTVEVLQAARRELAARI